MQRTLFFSQFAACSLLACIGLPAIANPAANSIQLAEVALKSVVP